MPLSLYLDDDQVRQFPYNQDGIFPPIKNTPDFLDLNNEGPYFDYCSRFEVDHVSLKTITVFAQKQQELIPFIHKCVLKDDFPSEFGSGVRLWFQHFFTRIRRNLIHLHTVAKPRITPEKIIFEEPIPCSYDLPNQFILEMPRSTFIQLTSIESYDQTTPEIREDIFSALSKSTMSKHLSLKRIHAQFISWGLGPASVERNKQLCYVPRANHSSISLPQARHWNAWLEKMEECFPFNSEFDSLRDLCYNISTLLSDPDLGSYKRDYLQSWILGAAAQIKK